MGFQPIRSDWNDEHSQALTAFKQAGMSASEIAKRMNLTRGQVLGRIWRMEHPYVPRPRTNAWTHQQMEIVRRGALHGACIDEICELLAKAGRELKPKAVQDSRYYRLGMAQAKAVEERLLRQQRTSKPTPRPGVYQWRHPEGAIINLPIVKGYVGEQAHG